MTIKPLYGVTVDGISPINEIVAGLKALPQKPTTRVVFDWNKGKPEPVSEYTSAVAAIHEVSYVMGELLDSYYTKDVTVAELQAMATTYLKALGDTVDIWEIGNEVNGNWTGPYPTQASKITAAFDVINNAGKSTALTLYYNDPNGTNLDGSAELTPVQFSEVYVTPTVRQGLDYVLLSYYPTEFNDIYPTNATLATLFEQLHDIYPNALLGFGELGIPNYVNKKSLATAEHVMSWGYGLDPGLSYYCGGYFWWGALEDCFTGKKLMASQLSAAFTGEANELG